MQCSFINQNLILNTVCNRLVFSTQDYKIVFRGATFIRLSGPEPVPNRIRTGTDPDPVYLDRIWFEKYNRLNYGYG